MRRPWGQVKPPPWVEIDPDYVDRTGLVGAWTMADGGGPILRDYGPYRRDGTIVSGLWDTGQYGPALSFNGTSTVVTVSDHPAFAFGAGDFAVSCWVYFRNVTGLKEIIGKALSSGTFVGWLLRCHNIGQTTFGPFAFLPYNAGGAIVLGTTIPAINTWYHVVAQRWGTTIEIWVNGIRESQATNSSNITSNATLMFGGDNTGWAGSYADMILDNVLLFSKSQSESDIQESYFDPWTNFPAPRRTTVRVAAVGGGAYKTWYAGRGAVMGSGVL
jgi:hypothetical protein